MDISPCSPNINNSKNINVYSTYENSNNSSESAVTDSICVEASSSSAAVEDSLDGFITATRKNSRPKQPSTRTVVPPAAITPADLLKKRSTPPLVPGFRW